MEKEVKFQEDNKLNIKLKEEKFSPIYSYYTQTERKLYLEASIEEQDAIEAAMREAEESYHEMMEIHRVLDLAYKDLINLKSI